MEPLKPTRKREILQASPSATPEEIAEYEKLLSERFTVDPSLVREPAAFSIWERKSARLKELRQKLFPNAEGSGEQDNKSH